MKASRSHHFIKVTETVFEHEHAYLFRCGEKVTRHTTISLPAFSGRFAILSAAAAAAPDDIPVYKNFAYRIVRSRAKNERNM